MNDFLVTPFNVGCRE